MSAVCYCGRPDCSVTSMARDACLVALRAERDALKADVEAVEAMRQDTARRLEAAAQMHRQAEARVVELEACLQELLDEHLNHLSESTYTERARAALAKPTARQILDDMNGAK